jgi:hypothetical protein
MECPPTIALYAPPPPTPHTHTHPPTHLPPSQLLCECLLYACCIQQRQRPADIIELLDVLHRLSLRARSGGGGGGDVLAAQQQAYSVLAAALCCLLPLENAEGAGALLF